MWRSIINCIWERCYWRVATERKPDVIIGGDTPDPYMRRWWLIPRNPLFNVYLHDFRRSDDDRALHDHPWMNLSILLRGEYLEHTIDAGGCHRKVLRKAGDMKFRFARAAHRIELVSGRCWTMFITGPRLRDWGFHCANTGWVSHEDFTAVSPDGVSITGAGCGEV